MEQTQQTYTQTQIRTALEQWFLETGIFQNVDNFILFLSEVTEMSTASETKQHINNNVNSQFNFPTDPAEDEDRVCVSCQ